MNAEDNRRPRLHVVVPPRAEHAARVALPETVTDLRPSSADTVLALVKAADLGGLDGVVLPPGPDELEPWVLGAHLLRRTRHVTVFVPVGPGTATPHYAAKFTASLQRFSEGRAGWVAGEDAASQDFVAAARAFWSADDGLPPHLSARAFPHVLTERVLTGGGLTEGGSNAVRLRTAGVEADDLAARLREVAADGVADVLLDVAGEPGEVYRIAERVVPALDLPLSPIGAAHVG